MINTIALREWRPPRMIERRTVTPGALMITKPCTSSASITVLALVITRFPLRLVRVVPAGTPVVAAVGAEAELEVPRRKSR